MPDLGERPDCWSDMLWPCWREDWQKCDRCRRYICNLHDCLFEVRHMGAGEYGRRDWLCDSCVKSAYANGEISAGDWEYILVK
jgi:hypothetical protein